MSVMPLPTPGTGLDQHGVSVLDQGMHRGRNHADAVLVILDLFGNSDDHFEPPVAVSVPVEALDEVEED